MTTSTQYIQNMMSGFKIPARDAIVECLLAAPSERELVWDAAILLSTQQSENFYTDIFQFWVRAFFSFVEDTRTGSMFSDAVPLIACREISPEQFQRDYLALLHQRIPDPWFIESQSYPKTYVELEKRSFSDSYVILDSPNIKSSVAHSHGEYVAYFITAKSSSRVRLITK